MISAGNTIKGIKENRASSTLFVEQIKLIYDNALPSTISILIVAFLGWVGLREAIPGWLLDGWAGYMLVVAVVRLTLYFSYKKHFDESHGLLWAGLIIASAISAGIGWAGVSLFVHIATDPAYKIIIVMIVLGIMAATVPVLSAVLTAFYCASLPPAFTLLGVIYLWDTSGSSLLFAALVIYTGLVVYTAKNTNRILLRTLRLQRDKESLIENLNDEIGERTNAQRQLEIHKEHLEETVEQRTHQLTKSNLELEREVSERKRSEQALSESHARFTAVLDTLDAAVYVTDMKTYDVLFMNRYAIERWGDQVGTTCWRTLKPDQEGPCSYCTNHKLLDVHGHSTGIHSWEYQVPHTGEWIECRDQAIRWPDGQLVRMEIATDITNRVMAEQRIREEHQFLQTIIDGVADPIMVVDLDCNIKLMNKAASLGSPAMETLSANKCFQVTHGRSTPCSGSDHQCPLKVVSATREPVTVIHRHKTEDGSERLYEIVGTPLFDGQQQLTGMVQASRDITVHIQTQEELQEKKNRLEHVAHHDALTSLPNRVLLADRLHQAMAQTQRRSMQLAVAYLDLDGFKEINDTHGHEVGDQFLIALARRMKDLLREGDTIARLGGDEFVSVLMDLAEPQDSIPLLNRMLAATLQPVHVGDLVLRVSGSVGVTCYPQAEAVDADQLLRQADQAMYKAKLTGKNRYHFFEAEKDRGLRGQHQSIEGIRVGLVLREFALFYQPKVNMRTGEVSGFEALIRWRHPERGLLLPGSFLPFIEDNPLAIELDEWVIDEALHQIENWKSSGLDFSISVNIGARFLQQKDFVERLQKLLDAHTGVEPSQLELEVLETSALDDMAQVSEVMRTCGEMGVSFALDDFGTGYSSLTYLKRLPAAFLKIDQSFVRNMLDDPEDLAILEGVLGLAMAFRRQAIAEGVETQEHGELLLQLGCELAQGYAIAKPMPASDLPGWVEQWRPDPAWFHLSPVSRDDLPLLFAGVEHRAWIRSIENCLKGNRSVLPALDHRKCKFGTWLESTGLDRYGERDNFPVVEQLHQRVHKLAEELCGDHAQSENRPENEIFDALHDLRDALIRELKRMVQDKGIQA